jgi:uncharacterized protein YbbK (DUF523 family)
MAAPPTWRAPDLPIRIGISSCLLGEEVRHDGGHQKDAYITGVLADHFTWVPVCPELEVGMGVPREPIRLVGDAAAPRLVGVTSGADHTARMHEFARRRVDEPLVVPITLINHHVARFDVAYIRDQIYLRPHPKELMLRNHV